MRLARRDHLDGESLALLVEFEPLEPRGGLADTGGATEDGQRRGVAALAVEPHTLGVLADGAR